MELEPFASEKAKAETAGITRSFSVETKRTGASKNFDKIVHSTRKESMSEN